MGRNLATVGRVAILCLKLLVFLPSFLRSSERCHSGTIYAADRTHNRCCAVNAAVVGLLLAALYNPVWNSGITGPYDFALGVTAFLLLFMWQAPPWLVVVLSALGGGLVAAISALAYVRFGSKAEDNGSGTKDTVPLHPQAHGA